VSPLPAMGSIGAELYAANEPLAYADPSNDYGLAVLCGAIGAMWQAVADLSEERDGRPGWANLVDVETSPTDALPWLAQIPGVELTAGATPAQQRDEVRRRSGQARCRPASMRDEAKLTLSGTNPQVRIVERTTSAWTLTVITRTSETPNPAATLAALLRQKVGGDVLTHVVSNAPIIDEWTRTLDATTAVIDSLTIADVT
jgi:hypothetical protein